MITALLQIPYIGWIVAGGLLLVVGYAIIRGIVITRNVRDQRHQVLDQLTILAHTGTTAQWVAACKKYDSVSHRRHILVAYTSPADWKDLYRPEFF